MKIYKLAASLFRQQGPNCLGKVAAYSPKYKFLEICYSYLVTCDEKRCPNKEPGDSLGSGRHEEKRLLWPDHRGNGCPGGVGPLWGHSTRGAWRKAIRGVASQPLRQALGSPPKLTHLFEDSGASSLIMLRAIRITPNFSNSCKKQSAEEPPVHSYES